MPEWPEVGVVKESLRRRLLGKQIKQVDVYWNNIIVTPIEAFKKELLGQTIREIDRFGKYLIFFLDDYNMLVHLRMEGKFFYRMKAEERSKHEHVIFSFDDFELRYHDTRKFGKMYLLKKEELWTKKPLINLGLDPYSKDLTKEYLYQKLKSKTIPIKTTLLDQSIIVGIGNIYADEILFQSKIHPLKKSNQVTKKQLDCILQNMRVTFQEAMKQGGTTIRSYISEEGVHGRFQQSLLVHTKEGLPCPVCGDNIQKIVVGGRGTNYCPTCQKEQKRKK